MEDDKKMSAIAEETKQEVVEIVQQEAELPENENQDLATKPVENTTVPTPEVPVAPQPDEAVSATPEPTVESASADESHDGEEEHHEENPYDAVVLDGATKKELLDWLKKIAKEDNIRKVDHLFKDLAGHFETIFNEEKKSALEDFLKTEGNEEADFEFKGDQIDREFNELYETMRHKRSHYFHQLEKQKEDNLGRKTEILDLIRQAVDGEDQTSFNKVKKLQEEWKKIGPVPGAQNKTLWASYHALMDRFYDQRSIYFELKELDRKKNLEAKLDVCSRAEALDPKNLKQAIVALNELHEEFKHIGPVPAEDQEPLWQRFKAASDRVYDHRKEFTEQQKEAHRINLEKKQVLAAKAGEFAAFASDRIKDWNQKTKQLLELQKEWDATGMVPREKAREINKAFWGGFKIFFNNKNKFFKSLDAEREGNLTKKRALVERAKSAKDNEDWDSTAKLMKDLQNEWRELGPVPEKYRKSIYDEFKGYCDAFFERRRGQNAEQNKEFNQNLDKKLEILNQLESLSKENPLHVDTIFDLASGFSEIGLVPRNAVGKVLDRYDGVAKRILASSSLSEEDRADLKMHFEICKLRNSPHGNQKINRKENTLKRRITGLENDINTWQTNIDFFASSKNADQLKKEFTEKIASAKEELVNLKNQLRLMRD